MLVVLTDGARRLRLATSRFNVIPSAEGWLFLDFESTCTGAIEADLSFLPSYLLTSYGAYDEARLELFAAITSLQVATWCLLGSVRSPQLLDHVPVHVERVRSWLMTV